MGIIYSHIHIRELMFILITIKTKYGNKSINANLLWAKQNL